MTGALAPFSYLVINIGLKKFYSIGTRMERYSPDGPANPMAYLMKSAPAYRSAEILVKM